jgi:PAS domain-containing protein
MAQKEIEVILTRQLASYLAMPIIIIDSTGTLLFYNEPAEVIFGMRFEETGELSADEWAQTLVVTDERGTPLAPETRPLLIALTERRPTHCDMWLQGLDHVRRHIEVTAFPLIGQAGGHLGAVGIFWEVEK